MLNREKSSVDSFFESFGRFCFLSIVASSAIFLTMTVCKHKRNKKDDYQDRLRKAYEGLSPEEY
ncbi:MAG: hypothetical protein FWF00_06735 [Endomicrobia bacterium]|nr:hypothetical protein [Endomicrobiia bacterium]MCL2507360.1 hypothetical protein [Endomicrobiia bacterium]